MILTKMPSGSVAPPSRWTAPSLVKPRSMAGAAGAVRGGVRRAGFGPQRDGCDGCGGGLAGRAAVGRATVVRTAVGPTTV